MDHHKLLLALTKNEKHGQNFDGSLQQIITNVTAMLPDENQLELANFQTTLDQDGMVRYRYLKTVLYVLKSLRSSNLSSSDTFLSVNQHRTVKAAVEIAVSIGILPCLFPGVGPGISNMCSRAKKLDNEKLTDLQKYERLSFTVHTLTDFFEEVALRPALLPQLGPLLGGLLQLSYAPLAKPSPNVENEKSEGKSEPSEFKMTRDLYEKLTKDQSEFRGTLSSVMEKCPQTMIVKELMIILGIKGAPKWIRRITQNYLVDAIVRPRGILALIDAVCGDDIDLGVHWNKLDTVARLVATSQGQDPDKYYEAVCSQLVKLLKSGSVKYSTIISNSCITALHDHNPDVCVSKIIRVIAVPLRIDASTEAESLPRTETEITDCIENLTKCFVPEDAKFKHPPCILLGEVALPLFCLYAKARRSVTHLQTKIRGLLIQLLNVSSLRDDLFAAFLDHDEKRQASFGQKLSCKFGPSGGLEITGETEYIDHEIAADSLFDLVANDANLGFNLFNYLLRSFSILKEKKSEVLENSDDTLGRIGRQLGAMKLLSSLAAERKIQDAQINDPEPILSFIKSMFNERAEKQTANENMDLSEAEDENIEVLYVSLMLVKVILTDCGKPGDWRPFEELSKFLKNLGARTKIPQPLQRLVEELLGVIEKRGKSATRCYQDLSLDDFEKESDFEKALRDLADPLLPVRAHGLIALTKLLEKKDPEAVAKKDVILCFFQENLKDDDSFVYLSAVNGLCALATIFPDKVLEILVQEYIDMPQRNTNGEISPENRAKLGEILVKTTRSLGEMCPAYKTVLINGFLCGTRDQDDMVRASSLSCLGEICKVMGFRLGHAINEIIYCIGCIINTDKSPECRRAAVLVATLLIRGLGKDVLTDLGNDLVRLYRALKFLRDNDDDQVLRLHAQLALEELDDIVQTQLFTMPKLEKRLFLLP